ncbi:MAG: hypothetical protein ACREF4_08455, partial [Gammaproteobacteria bacterium]
MARERIRSQTASSVDPAMANDRFSVTIKPIAVLGGVRVEAWDKDFGADDYLGSASTITDGSFVIRFDDTAFRDLFDVLPDLYFKVYCYNQLLASTENSVLWSVQRPTIGVTIKATAPTRVCDERHIYLK